MKQRETLNDREDIARHARCRWCRKRSSGRQVCFHNDVAVTRQCKLFHPGYLEATAKGEKKSSKTLTASNEVSSVLIVDFSVADFDRTRNVYLLLAEITVFFTCKVLRNKSRRRRQRPNIVALNPLNTAGVYLRPRSRNARHLQSTRKQKGTIKEEKNTEGKEVGGGGTSSLLKQAGMSMGGSAQTHQLLNQGESGAAVKINDLNTANSSQWRSVEEEEEGEEEEEAPIYAKAWREGSGGESRPSGRL